MNKIMLSNKRLVYERFFFEAKIVRVRHFVACAMLQKARSLVSFYSSPFSASTPVSHFTFFQKILCLLGHNKFGLASHAVNSTPVFFGALWVISPSLLSALLPQRFSMRFSFSFIFRIFAAWNARSRFLLAQLRLGSCRDARGCHPVQQ
jgi:hypothetical protein